MTPNRPPISKVLVANRGEVAVRIIRAVRGAGLRSVAVYSDTDMDTLPVQLADEAYALLGVSAGQTYLNMDALLAAAQKSGADAVHPGYGFLSEDPAFARAVTAAGLTWIGPAAPAIAALGDKISARALAQRHQVPVIPGVALAAEGAAARQQVEELAAQAGYPLLIKRADSGGGRGIHRLENVADLQRFFADLDPQASLEGCFAEKMLTRARHVETQCLRDTQGHFVVVSTRDCSVQRRNQKVVEEAPAPHLAPELECELVAYSQRLFAAVDYVGVGTCEFLITEEPAEQSAAQAASIDRVTSASADPLVASGSAATDSAAAISSRQCAYFLEVNPRLQVEHTVSEEITGLDLVAEQLRIAAGQPLSCQELLAKQPPVALLPTRGHSLEVRITSEDPAQDLLPATGQITDLHWPGGPGVRVDTFVRPGEQISANFDSLIAKLIVTGPTRAQAIARLLCALGELQVRGLPTPVPLLREILTHPDFYGSDQPERFAVYTTWLEETGLLEQVKNQLEAEQNSPDHAANRSANPAASARAEASQEAVKSCGPVESYIEIDGRRVKLRFPADLGAQMWGLVGSQVGGLAGGLGKQNPNVTPNAGAGLAAPGVSLTGTGLRTQSLLGRSTGATPANSAALNSAAAAANAAHTTASDPADAAHIVAPIQGLTVRVAVEVGQQVAAGDLVVVMESMKMEKPLYAPAPGTVRKILVAPADPVTAGQIMVEIDPETPQEQA